MENSEENNAKKILIIEEQSIVSLELQKKLEKGGYEVQSANSFEHMPNSVNPDLVVTDASPNDSWFQVIKKVWMGKLFPIVCTSTECTEGFVKVKDYRIVASFLKPFDSQEILNAINNYFKESTKKLTAKLTWKRKN